MNWEAISAISEIIGAAAVVLSLIYLATQVRSGSKATRATVHMGLHDSEAQFISLLLSDPDLRVQFNKIGAGDPTISTADQAAVSLLLTLLFNKYELYFFLSREGVFSSDVESAMTRIITERLKSPGIKAWWDDSQDQFSAEFVQWTNEKCYA